MENKFKRCAADDPKRCQAVTSTGQCPYLSNEESLYCPMHGGNGKQEEQKRISNYRLMKFQARVNDFMEHPEVKSLRDEIGITRMLLEQIINSCQNETDLIMKHGKISDLVLKIEKLVTSCHRIEISSGGLLDKTKVIGLANQIIDILSKNIEDKELLALIADQLANIR